MKAPAFQFYYDRFLGATITWDDAQVGQMIRLMCIQANKGYVTEKDMIKICHTHDIDVLSKFPEIEAGKFANKVLADVLAQREAYSISRAENRKKGYISNTHEKDMNNICSSCDEHMVVVDKVVVKEKGIGVEKEKPKSKKDGISQNAKDVIHYFNQAYGSHFKESSTGSARLIDICMKEVDSIQDIFDVIDYKIAEWKGTEMQKHITPETIFRLSNFQKYLNQVQNAKDHNLTENQIKGQNGFKGKKLLDPMDVIRYSREKNAAK